MVLLVCYNKPPSHVTIQQNLRGVPAANSKRLPPRVDHAGDGLRLEQHPVTPPVGEAAEWDKHPIKKGKQALEQTSWKIHGWAFFGRGIRVSCILGIKDHKSNTISLYITVYSFANFCAYRWCKASEQQIQPVLKGLC